MAITFFATSKKRTQLIEAKLDLVYSTLCMKICNWLSGNFISTLADD